VEFHKGRKYRLSFGTSAVWDLSAESQVQGWIDHFAEILTLPECYDEQDLLLHCRRAQRLDFIGHPELFESGAPAESHLESLQTILLSTSSGGDVTAYIDHGGDMSIAMINMCRLLYPVYRSIIKSGGVPFHAAMAEHEGKAYLLAGGSGTGKSTCSSRLHGEWLSRCDDEVLVVCEPHNRYRVHPMPTWSSFLNGGMGKKFWDVSLGVPLAGIFFLERSKDRDAAVPLLKKAENAAAMNASVLQIWQKYSNFSESEQRKEMHCLIFENVCRMAHHIPAYRLSVTLDGMFWVEMEKVTGISEVENKKNLQV